jgi:plasmid stabilization system protein ParE
MYKLVVSKFAHEDLDNIILYIAVQLVSPAAATNFLNEVEKCYGYLKSDPFMYERCKDIRLGKEGYRKATIKNYVLVYKVNEIAKEVMVYRFFYGAQDYVKLI